MTLGAAVVDDGRNESVFLPSSSAGVIMGVDFSQGREEGKKGFNVLPGFRRLDLFLTGRRGDCYS